MTDKERNDLIEALLRALTIRLMAAADEFREKRLYTADSVVSVIASHISPEAYRELDR